MRALIVEDDADLRRILRRSLEEEEIDVEAVSSGHAAIDAATARAPDLLVLDIGLPDADGRDVCQALRAQGIAAPVIFLTARDAVTDRLPGVQARGGRQSAQALRPGRVDRAGQGPVEAGRSPSGRQRRRPQA